MHKIKKSNLSYFNTPKQSFLVPYKLIKFNINSTNIGSKNNITTATTLFIKDCPAFFIESCSPDAAAFIKSIVPSTITNISAAYFTKFNDIFIHFLLLLVLLHNHLLLVLYYIYYHQYFL